MKRDLPALEQTTFDLVIIGGGITGAGVALDAASRGYRAALIDKGDFASGTSSASSKLIHGGLRYLEYGQLGLVGEALQERALLLRNAPHLVQPLPFLLPFYRGQRLSPWQWRLGLTVYDLLAGRANIARSRPCSARHLQMQDSSLRASELLGGALYWDALMDDARLCLAVLQTAARHGAALANYVEAIGFERHQGALAGLWARDRVADRRFLIRGRVVVNAAGPWADAVARLAGDKGPPHLQPTKGVHLIAPHRHLRTAYLLLHPRDGRVFFIIPWQGKTLIGTTDTFAESAADSVMIQPEDIAYMLEGFNHYYHPGLRPEDVMGAFAGLRPLLRDRPGAPSARSREFRIVASPGGLVTVVGGKYTTYRQMAETIVDYLGPRLGHSGRCRTRTLPLEGAPREPWPAFLDRTVAEICRDNPVALDSAINLVHRYGERVFDVVQTLRRTAHGFARLLPDEPDLLGEQAYQRAEEMALFPEDLLLRRSRIGMYCPHVVGSAAASRATGAT